MQVIPDPKTMAAIKDLSLAAKTIVDGFMSGINHSRLKGEGVEFSQYRNYLPGDDLRNLDWKVFGRTGRYYIRQSEPERTIAVHLVVDASASMEHDCGGYSKMQYARSLAAALALLAYRQGDKVGLSLINEQGVQRLAPGQHSQQLQRVYQALGQIEAKGRLEGPEGYKHLLQSNGKELLVFITDFYEHQEEISRLMGLLCAQGHEVILLHLLAANELDGQFKGYDAVEDLETGEVIDLDGMGTKASVLVKDYLEEAKRVLQQRKVYYCLLNANDTPERALKEFLTLRNRISR